MTTVSHLQRAYIDLDDVDGREFDVVVRQSDEGPPGAEVGAAGAGAVTTSTGIVLVTSIVVASRLGTGKKMTKA